MNAAEKRIVEVTTEVIDKSGDLYDLYREILPYPERDDVVPSAMALCHLAAGLLLHNAGMLTTQGGQDLMLQMGIKACAQLCKEMTEAYETRN